MEVILLMVFAGVVYMWKKKSKETKEITKELISKNSSNIDAYFSCIKLFEKITLEEGLSEEEVHGMGCDLRTNTTMYLLEASDCALKHCNVDELLHGDAKFTMLFNLGYEEMEAKGVIYATKNPLRDPFSGEMLQCGGYSAFEEWLHAPDEKSAIKTARININKAVGQWVTDERLSQQINHSR